MTDTLFTSQIPGLPDVNEASPVSVANTVLVAAAGTTANARFYGPTTIGVGTYAADLYQMTGLSAGTLIASASFSSPASGVWNVAAWSGGPYALLASTAYKIVLRTSAGRYCAQSAFWTSQLVSGNLTGIQDGANPVGFGAMANGTFVSGLVNFPPNANTFNSNGYWVDFDHTVAATGVTPSGLAVPVALGSPASTLNLSATPSGLAVPVGLGSPASALNRSAAPSGLAVPVGLGSPSVVAAANPAGLAVPVSLGSPAAGPTVGGGNTFRNGWWTLSAISEENASLAEVDSAPVACPNDGEPLQTGPDGFPFCPFDGWRPAGAPTISASVRARRVR